MDTTSEDEPRSGSRRQFLKGLAVLAGGVGLVGRGLGFDERRTERRVGRAGWRSGPGR